LAVFLSLFVVAYATTITVVRKVLVSSLTGSKD
jgi:hypothetical protein